MSPFNLDKTDLRILSALQDDAGQTNVDLAGRVGLSPSPAVSACRPRRACAG